MNDEATYIALINDLLNWREGAHAILGDYLEQQGFGRRFHEQGGLFTRVRVVIAIYDIQAIDTPLLSQLCLSAAELQELAEQGIN